MISLKSMERKKIVHITIVHKRYDVRIFRKECVSLSKAGHDVSLIVADGLGDEETQGVKIIDIGKAEASRIKRMIKTSRKAVDTALGINADIYHFHDPDLLIEALRLKKKGKVIFDSHEDLPALMLERPYIPNAFRKILYHVAEIVEKFAVKTYLSGVVTVSDYITDKFKSYGAKFVTSVKNFPLTYGVTSQSIYNPNTNTVCYTGGLTRIRAIKEMVIACSRADVKLIVAGEFDDSEYQKEVMSLPEWNSVEYLGFLPSTELKEKVLDRASIGIILFINVPNHVNAIPTKQFEYMQAGLPVIASKEVLFCKQVTEEENCGLVVDPLNIDEVAQAIRTITSDSELAKQMSANAKQASADKYNWLSQEKSLLEFYQSLFD